MMYKSLTDSKMVDQHSLTRNANMCEIYLEVLAALVLSILDLFLTLKILYLNFNAYF
jgi:hypothetical protein